MQARYRQIRADQDFIKKKKSLHKLILTGIKRISITLGFLLLLWVTLGNLVANYYVAKTEREIEEEWGHVLTGDYNETTYRLQAIATQKLGLKPISWDHEDEHPIDMDVNTIEYEKWNEIYSVIDIYLEEQEKIDSKATKEPAAKLKYYLESKDQIIGEISETLTQKNPELKNDLSFYSKEIKDDEAFSHHFGFDLIILQEIVLANIYYNQSIGNRVKVVRDLEMLWMLNKSTSKPSSLLDLFIHKISTTNLLKSLVKIDKLSPIWSERLNEISGSSIQTDKVFFAISTELIFGFHQSNMADSRDVWDTIWRFLGDEDIEDEDVEVDTDESFASTLTNPIFFLANMPLKPLMKISNVDSYQKGMRLLRAAQRESTDTCKLHLFFQKNHIQYANWNMNPYVYNNLNYTILRLSTRVNLIQVMQAEYTRNTLDLPSGQQYPDTLYKNVWGIEDEEIIEFCSRMNSG